MRKQKLTLLILIIVVPVGFYTKFYSGPASNWVNNSLGGILYVVFWSLLVSVFVLKIKPLKIAFVVFMATCILEFLQLWHADFLEKIRSNFLGRTLLGHSFSGCDILYYIVGFIISVGLLKYLSRIEKGNI